MATSAFHDFEEWHPLSTCERVAVACHGGCGVMLLCLSCGKAADLEGLGGRCSLLESAEIRSEEVLVG